MCIVIKHCEFSWCK